MSALGPTTVGSLKLTYPTMWVYTPLCARVYPVYVRRHVPPTPIDSILQAPAASLVSGPEIPCVGWDLRLWRPKLAYQSYTHQLMINSKHLAISFAYMCAILHCCRLFVC